MRAKYPRPHCHLQVIFYKEFKVQIKFIQVSNDLLLRLYHCYIGQETCTPCSCMKNTLKGRCTDRSQLGFYSDQMTRRNNRRPRELWSLKAALLALADSSAFFMQNYKWNHLCNISNKSSIFIISHFIHTHTHIFNVSYTN